MHPRSILAIARKDALDILLNKTTLSLLLTPIVLALLFLLIANLLGSHTTNALIYDPGRSSVEQVLKSAYSDLKITYANSPGDVAAAFGPDGSHKTQSGKQPAESTASKYAHQYITQHSQSTTPCHYYRCDGKPAFTFTKCVTEYQSILRGRGTNELFTRGNHACPRDSSGRERKEDPAHADGFTCVLQ